MEQKFADTTATLEGATEPYLLHLHFAWDVFLFILYESFVFLIFCLSDSNSLITTLWTPGPNIYIHHYGKRFHNISERVLITFPSVSHLLSFIEPPLGLSKRGLPDPLLGRPKGSRGLAEKDFVVY